MKVQCLRCPASVHSTNATWQTSFGVTQRHSFIFSAVNDSPHREGREELVSNSRDETVLYLCNEDEVFVLVNAHQQRIECVLRRYNPLAPR